VHVDRNRQRRIGDRQPTLNRGTFEKAGAAAAELNRHRQTKIASVTKPIDGRGRQNALLVGVWRRGRDVAEHFS
jgi:hypothetical protein